MRGKVFGKSQKFAVCGITPAYAGKSIELSSNIMVSKDHPRLCGEKGIIKACNIVRIGSPPPMRGKDGYKAAAAKKSRITPAYAGKSLRKQDEQRYFEDHPRLCGEKPYSVYALDSGTGSPPPMRGKASSVRNTSIRSGITPAYAGKRLEAPFDDAMT